MKPIFTVLLLLSLFACNSSKKVAEATDDKKLPEVEVEEEVYIPVDEILKTEYPDSLVLRMQRTGCFGQCPIYQFEVFQSGLVVFEGKRFSDMIGTYHAQLTEEELKAVWKRAEDIGFYNMDNVYDSNISDFPSCYVYVKAKKNKNHVKTRRAGPVELIGFQKWLDDLVLGKKFLKQ